MCKKSLSFINQLYSIVDLAGPIYICSRCPKTFTRKWNTKRHGNSVHKGLSDIGTQFGHEAKTDYSFRRLGIQQDRYSVASNHGRFNTYGYQKNGYSSSFKQVSGGHPIKFKGSVNPMGVEEREDDLLNGRLEKIMVPFVKLERLLLDKVYRHENPVIINNIQS